MTDDAKSTAKRRKDPIGDDPPASKKPTAAEKAANAKASNDAAKAVDDSYKEKPDLVGDKADAPKRSREKDPKPIDPLKGVGDNEMSVAGKDLLSYLERRERLEEEKKAIADDIKDLHAELKGRGFDKKVFDRMIKVRKMDKSEFEEGEILFDTYMRAIGM